MEVLFIALDGSRNREREGLVLKKISGNIPS